MEFCRQRSHLEIAVKGLRVLPLALDKGQHILDTCPKALKNRMLLWAQGLENPVNYSSKMIYLSYNATKNFMSFYKLHKKEDQVKLKWSSSLRTWPEGDPSLPMQLEEARRSREAHPSEVGARQKLAFPNCNIQAFLLQPRVFLISYQDPSNLQVE